MSRSMLPASILAIGAVSSARAEVGSRPGPCVPGRRPDPPTRWRRVGHGAIALALAALSGSVPLAGAETGPPTDPQGTRVALGEDLEVQRLQEGLWLHTSRNELGPANGLILVNEEGVLVIDTPWTDGQTARLIDWIQDRLKAPIRHWVVTHSHADRMGGIRTVQQRGIPTYGSDRTAELAAKEGNPRPGRTFSDHLELAMGPDTAELFYPGPAHSPDNIVVWLRSRRVLFGGCMIRSAAAQRVGYTGAADLDAWPASVARVRERYPEAKLVVPGHGHPGGPELLEHTVRLVRMARDTGTK